MNLKTFYNKIVDSIYGNRKNIMIASFAILALLLLIIVLYFSSDNFNINKEVDTMFNYIEDRQYTMAQTYYENLEKEFSDSKMNRFNKKVSKKMSSLLVNNSDMYINGKITKEQYMGLVNTVNILNHINIDSYSLDDLSKRVEQMYKQENISYELAISYLQITSTLKGVSERLYEYKQHVEDFYESRNIYEEGTKQQSIKEYHDAITSYDKVLKEDEKYYVLAQSAKKQCIKEMYNYYISQAESLAEEGKYEEALKDLSYLNPYYNDEEISKLQDEYNKYISNYTMTSDDIKNLICRKSGEKEDDLSVVSYLQTVNGKRYYYGEVLKDDKVINEVLVDTETKKLYSYKSDKKDYNCNYSDGYFKVNQYDGKIMLSIGKERAQEILEEKFVKEKKEYKDIELLDDNEIEKYMNNDLKNMIDKNGNVYYYFLVKMGWFRPKEVYMVNIYDKTIYIVTKDEVVHK